jgi:cobalt-zinc-cadmium efflux system outer membrane protein
VSFREGAAGPRSLIVCIAWPLVWLALSAQARAAELTLSQVLQSVHEHHPLVGAELANVRAAAGEELSARGEFDTVLSVQGRIAPAGYYDPRRLDVVLEQPTPVLGASAYVGYRVTGGQVAPYYGELRTLDHGELRAGLRLPLLQDRATDGRRAARETTSLQREASESAYGKQLLELERDAAATYYAWVAAGRRLVVAENLAKLAKLRDAQVTEKVALGALPPVEGIENRRAILERERQLVQARRALEKATFDLSLFLRDDRGKQVAPARELLPGGLAAPAVDGVATPLEQQQRKALEARPELAQLEAQLEALRVERELAENRVQPRLDTFAEVSRDLGPVETELDGTLAPTVVEVGATFSLPLGLRRARGKLRAAEEKAASAQLRLGFARERVMTEVSDARSQLEAARERAALARDGAQAAEQVASGERERFELGASTLLFVNLREQVAADAMMALIDAEAESAFAAARLQLVQGSSLIER